MDNNIDEFKVVLPHLMPLCWSISVQNIKGATPNFRTNWCEYLKYLKYQSPFKNFIEANYNPKRKRTSLAQNDLYHYLLCCNKQTQKHLLVTAHHLERGERRERERGRERGDGEIEGREREGKGKREGERERGGE